MEWGCSMGVSWRILSSIPEYTSFCGAGPGEYSRGVIAESKQFWDSHSAAKEQEATEEQMHKLNFPPAIYSYLQPIYSIWVRKNKHPWERAL